MPTSPEELKRRTGACLLPFPVTDSATDGRFDAASYRRRLGWLEGFGPEGLMDDLLQRCFFSLIALRNRQPGCAVSMVKAGVRLIGRDAGPARSPLTERATLRSLVTAVGGI